MKKMLLILSLSCMSLACYAQKNPTILISNVDCSSVTKGNLTSCFQNNTNSNLDGYQLKQTLLYENGSSDESIASLGALQPNFFTIISTSTADIKSQKIVSIGYSVIKGDAANYRVMPGCTVEFTPTSISKSVIAIYKIDNNLYCK